ncbi:MAG: universal stress protein [Desulfobacterales bacterium]|jgi:nucleotide-binding universal stress UspA family protein
MATPPKPRLLVPIDGSDRSMNTVRYIAKFEPFHRMHLVLFHVFSKVPEGFWDLGTDPRSSTTVSEVRAWELQQRENITQSMDIAGQLLVKSGFPSNSVEVKIQNRKKGFARDIIREAQNGYYAVVTRRRGMTGMRGIVLGSVATKLVEKLSFLPLILVGRKPPGNKILLGFDGSEGARRAVDFVGRTMGESNFRAKLVYVMRGKENDDPEIQRLYLPAKYVQKIHKEMTTELEVAAKQLIAMGFKPHRVSTELISGVVSRARAIVREARDSEYGTIVMGRRGHSGVRDFFIGRVTNKVIHMARDRSVWVVR